jgi:hypothetical protein
MDERAANIDEEARASSGRRITGDLVRRALLGEVAVHSDSPLKIDGSGARLSGAVVEGEVDLSALRFERPILFERCTFDAAISLAHARLESFTLTGCRATTIDARGARIDGDVSSRMKRGAEPPPKVMG